MVWLLPGVLVERSISLPVSACQPPLACWLEASQSQVASLELVGVEASRRLALLGQELLWPRWALQRWALQRWALQEAVWLLRRVVPAEPTPWLVWQPVWRAQVGWWGVGLELLLVVLEQALQVRALPLQVWLGVQPSSPTESLCQERACSERRVELRYRRNSADCGSSPLRSH